MATTLQLLQQRSVGAVRIGMARHGIQLLQEQGAAKVRLPRGSHEAVLINTGGGLAGGDSFSTSAHVGAEARLTITSQAAERVYRSLGPVAHVQTELTVERAGSLLWLPQETILFDGAGLKRDYRVHLADTAEFAAVEAVILGRTERGEVVQHLQLRDHWQIWQQGRLLHVNVLNINGAPPLGGAALAGHKAFASLIMVSPRAEQCLAPLNQCLGPQGAASLWNGKLVARVLAADGFALRKYLLALLAIIAGPQGVPKSWTF